MKDNCLKNFIKYCSLNVLGMIGLSCYILADTFFIANGVGADGLTALNLALPIYSFIHGTGLMLGIGGSTKFSIYKCQNHYNDCNKMFTDTFLLSTLFSIIFIFVGLFFSEAITTATGADGHIYDMTKTYLKILLLFSPAFIFNDIFVCFVRNDGNPNLAMFAMLFGSVSNIIMDYIFIYPMKLGMLGAVLATGVSPIIGMLILSIHIIKKRHHFHFMSLSAFKFIPKISLNIMSLGVPSLIAEVASGVVIIVFNTVILDIEGNIGVAAYGVIANISLVAVSIYTGIAEGIQPLLCNAYGSGKFTGINSIMKYSLITLTVISSIIYVGVFIFADPITAAFNNGANTTLQDIAVSGMKVYFTSMIFIGFNTVISVFFTSVEKPFPAQVITILRGFLIIIPVTFIFAMLFGMTGVWLAYPVTELMVSIIGFIFYKKLHNKI